MKSQRFITAYRCPRGCLWLHEHPNCPHCGGRLTGARMPAAATLISNTTIRVNPTGAPIQLGIARAAAGTCTLCIVVGNVRGNGRDRVVLVLHDGKYYAVARGARLIDTRQA